VIGVRARPTARLLLIGSAVSYDAVTSELHRTPNFSMLCHPLAAGHIRWPQSRATIRLVSVEPLIIFVTERPSGLSTAPRSRPAPPGARRAIQRFGVGPVSGRLLRSNQPDVVKHPRPAGYSVATLCGCSRRLFFANGRVALCCTACSLATAHAYRSCWSRLLWISRGARGDLPRSPRWVMAAPSHRPTVTSSGHVTHTASCRNSSPRFPSDLLFYLSGLRAGDRPV